MTTLIQNGTLIDARGKLVLVDGELAVGNSVIKNRHAGRSLRF